jgi:hypothetical protein
MTTLDELERAVERATEEARLAVECRWPWAALRPSELRLLLSERAELLATVERMRGYLPNLLAVIAWLENGGDPKHAATELRIYQERIARAALTTGEANHKDKP